MLMSVMLTTLGQVNSASWTTNQGPQPLQWDQSGPADNQSGQFPHSPMPQEPYGQVDQQGQLQHGTVLLFYDSIVCCGSIFT